MRDLIVRWVVFALIVAVAKTVVGFESTVIGLLLALLVYVSILGDPPRGR